MKTTDCAVLTCKEDGEDEDEDEEEEEVTRRRHSSRRFRHGHELLDGRRTQLAPPREEENRDRLTRLRSRIDRQWSQRRPCVNAGPFR